MANRDRAQRLLWVLVGVLVLGLAVTSAGYAVAIKRQVDEAERLKDRREQLEQRIAALRAELAQPLPAVPSRPGSQAMERHVPAKRELDGVLASLQDIGVDTGVTFVSLRVRTVTDSSALPAPASDAEKGSGESNAQAGSSPPAQGEKDTIASSQGSREGGPEGSSGPEALEAQWAAYRKRYGIPDRIPIVPTEIVWTFDAPWDRVDDVLKRLESLERVVWVTAWTVHPPEPEEEPMPSLAPAPSSEPGNTADHAKKAAQILHGEPLRVQLTLLVFHAPPTSESAATAPSPSR